MSLRARRQAPLSLRGVILIDRAHRRTGEVKKKKELEKMTNRGGRRGGRRGETLKGLQRKNLPGPVNPDRKQHVSERLHKILEVTASNFSPKMIFDAVKRTEMVSQSAAETLSFSLPSKEEIVVGSSTLLAHRNDMRA